MFEMMQLKVGDVYDQASGLMYATVTVKFTKGSLHLREAEVGLGMSKLEMEKSVEEAARRITALEGKPADRVALLRAAQRGPEELQREEVLQSPHGPRPANFKVRERWSLLEDVTLLRSFLTPLNCGVRGLWTDWCEIDRAVDGAHGFHPKRRPEDLRSRWRTLKYDSLTVPQLQAKLASMEAQLADETAAAASLPPPPLPPTPDGQLSRLQELQAQIDEVDAQKAALDKKRAELVAECTRLRKPLTAYLSRRPPPPPRAGAGDGDDLINLDSGDEEEMPPPPPRTVFSPGDPEVRVKVPEALRMLGAASGSAFADVGDMARLRSKWTLSEDHAIIAGLLDPGRRGVPPSWKEIHAARPHVWQENHKPDSIRLRYRTLTNDMPSGQRKTRAELEVWLQALEAQLEAEGVR